MSFLGKTFDKWIRYRIIQIGLALVFAFSIVFFIIPIRNPEYELFFGFWVEMVAVFCALIFGFYWERAHESIKQENRIDQILALFMVELRENVQRMWNVFFQGRGDYIAYSTKTTVWEVYKESLGDAEIETVDELTEIYYSLNLLNTGILRYAGDSSISDTVLERFSKIRDETIKKVNAWLTMMDAISIS